jgi:hypothetical protein
MQPYDRTFGSLSQQILQQIPNLNKRELMMMLYETYNYNYSMHYGPIFVNPQYGGAAQDEKLKVNYDGMFNDGENTFVFIPSSMNEPSCISATIFQGSDFVEITGINNSLNCSIPKTLNRIGSAPLKVMIKFLEKNKKKLGINKIILKDNSYKHCQDCVRGT